MIGGRKERVGGKMLRTGEELGKLGGSGKTGGKIGGKIGENVGLIGGKMLGLLRRRLFVPQLNAEESSSSHSRVWR